MPGKLYLIYFFGLLFPIVNCQSDKNISINEKYFSEVIVCNMHCISADDIHDISSEKLLETDNLHIPSETIFMSYEAVNLIIRKELLSETGNERTEYFEILKEVCKDKESSVNGTASMALAQSNRSDFSDNPITRSINHHTDDYLFSSYILNTKNYKTLISFVMI